MVSSTDSRVIGAEAVAAIREQLAQLWLVPDSALDRHVADLFDPRAKGAVSHPVDELASPADLAARYYRPLRAALSHARRRDEVFFAGLNRRATGGFWIAAICHTVGNLDSALFGIRPHHHLAFLRSGEFYQIENGKIVDFRIISDFIDLMRQAGQMPFAQSLGAEITYPGPATHDGIVPDDPALGERSLDLVEAMLSDLTAFDPESFQSAGQHGTDGYWAEDMLWYGPAGIGSNYRWAGFEKDHRIPFLTAFPDRVGGAHYCRIGNGAYAAVSGWPSMQMTHLGDYLGIPATGKALTLRVMDFYRCDRGKIAENWVFLDYGDLLRQMGITLFS